jgi:hypothetical protein
MATQKNCYDNPAGWYLRIMIVPGERATMHKGIFTFWREKSGQNAGLFF